MAGKVDTNINSYPWLCSTMPKVNDWDCYNTDTGNMVTDDEGKQAEAYTTDVGKVQFINFLQLLYILTAHIIVFGSCGNVAKLEHPENIDVAYL